MVHIGFHEADTRGLRPSWEPLNSSVPHVSPITGSTGTWKSLRLRSIASIQILWSTLQEYSKLSRIRFQLVIMFARSSTVGLSIRRRGSTSCWSRRRIWERNEREVRVKVPASKMRGSRLTRRKRESNPKVAFAPHNGCLLRRPSFAGEHLLQSC